MCQALEGYEPHPNRLRCRAHQAEVGPLLYIFVCPLPVLCYPLLFLT